MKYKICSAIILFFSFLFVIYGDFGSRNMVMDMRKSSNGNLLVYWLPAIFGVLKLIYGIIGLNELLKKNYKNAIIILGALLLDGYAHIIGISGFTYSIPSPVETTYSTAISASNIVAGATK